jgi:hypothetical protein
MNLLRRLLAAQKGVRGARGARETETRRGKRTPFCRQRRKISKRTRGNDRRRRVVFSSNMPTLALAVNHPRHTSEACPRATGLRRIHVSRWQQTTQQQARRKSPLVFFRTDIRPHPTPGLTQRIV